VQKILVMTVVVKAILAESQVCVVRMEANLVIVVMVVVANLVKKPYLRMG
jgi:hypothetical protein